MSIMIVLLILGILCIVCGVGLAVLAFLPHEASHDADTQQTDDPDEQ